MTLAFAGMAAALRLAGDRGDAFGTYARLHPDPPAQPCTVLSAYGGAVLVAGPDAPGRIGACYMRGGPAGEDCEGGLPRYGSDDPRPDDPPGTLLHVELGHPAQGFGYVMTLVDGEWWFVRGRWTWTS